MDIKTFRLIEVISTTLIMKLSRLLLLLFLVFTLTFTGCDRLKKLSGILGGDGKTLSAGSSESSLGTDAPALDPTLDIPVKTEGPIIVKGYLKGLGDSTTFEVKAGDIDELRVAFTFPGEPVDFWVKINGEDGETLLDDIKLRKGFDIVLLNGGTFHLTVYSKAGEGNWSAAYTLLPDDTVSERGIGSDSNCIIMENSASGSLNGPGESCEIPVKVDDLLEVTFIYPKDTVDFWVEITGPDGKTTVGDSSLSENNVVTLNGTINGKGTFKLTIYSNYGSGNWSATW